MMQVYLFLLSYMFLSFYFINCLWSYYFFRFFSFVLENMWSLKTFFFISIKSNYKQSFLFYVITISILGFADTRTPNLFLISSKLNILLCYHSQKIVICENAFLFFVLFLFIRWWVYCSLSARPAFKIWAWYNWWV